jgi:nucleotide-binding universal stress UspA family protein
VGHQRVLLASHGTAGARAAEVQALASCAAGATLYHLYVVPDLWRGMMGDDWLNNVRTRIRFGEYLEGELANEADACLDRVAAACVEAGLVHEPLLRQGEPAACLLDAVSETACGLVVVGMPRARGEEGLRSRLALEPLVRGLRVPLLIAPRVDA